MKILHLFLLQTNQVPILYSTKAFAISKYKLQTLPKCMQFIPVEMQLYDITSAIFNLTVQMNHELQSGGLNEENELRE